MSNTHPSDASQHLDFPCPHCGGPLHVEVLGEVICEVGHRFTVEQVSLEQARESSRAAWRAIRSLEDRAKSTRWALSDPVLTGFVGDHVNQDSADSDDETAKTLRRYAHSLDLTVAKLTTLVKRQPPLIDA